MFFTRGVKLKGGQQIKKKTLKFSQVFRNELRKFGRRRNGAELVHVAHITYVCNNTNDVCLSADISLLISVISDVTDKRSLSKIAYLRLLTQLHDQSSSNLLYLI